MVQKLYDLWMRKPLRIDCNMNVNFLCVVCVLTVQPTLIASCHTAEGWGYKEQQMPVGGGRDTSYLLKFYFDVVTMDTENDA